jgi:hypothetical protein
MSSLIDAPVDAKHRAPSLTPLAQLATTMVVVESLEHPIKNLRGVPLAVGCAMELGYFSRGEMVTPFRGRWLPLAGPFTVPTNRGIQFPRIGDGGAGPGCFAWRHTFPHGVETLAPTRIPLALRIYDDADPQAARCYNTVSNPSWWCRAPKAGTPALVYMSLDYEGTVWEGGPSDDFRTTLPVFGSMFARLMAISSESSDTDSPPRT